MVTDLTVFGATGFVGRLTAQHLAQTLPADASWAIAGRRASALGELADALEASGGVRPEVVVADIDSPTQMRQMAENTRVLTSVVGPYLTYGEPAVKAATEAGIAYLDLTGEPLFVDRMWLKYHEQAQRTGATLVHACGFDSVPYDLGVQRTVQALPEDVPLDVQLYVRVNATFSGGTFHSALAQMGQFRESGKVAARRHELEPRPEGRRVRGGGKPRKAPAELGGWALPLPLIDPIIVTRSAKALDRYGPQFSYEHYAHFKTAYMAAGAPLGVGAVALAAQVPPLRKALGAVRDPGDGPSEAQRARSWFRLEIFGSGGGQQVRTTVTGGDPGYTETAVMLGQASQCMAFDDRPMIGPAPATGQTTSAVAMGEALTRRLEAQGIAFTTVPATFAV